MKAFLIFVLLAVPVVGQVLQIGGGDSTLQNGAGASVKAYLPNSTITTGVGFADGHFGCGASDTFQSHGLDVTVGDSSFGFAPDSISGLAEQVRGLTVSRTRPDSTIAAFVGATGQGYSFPFFSAVDAHHFGGGLFAKRKIRGWQFAALAAIGGNAKTLTGSAAYAGRTVHFTSSGGIVNGGQRIGSGLFSYQPSQHFNIGASRQDLFWNGQQASIDSVSAFASVGAFTVNASALDGKSAGRPVSGASVALAARFGPVTLSSGLYESNHTTTTVQTVSENFRHWHFSEAVTGARSFSAGGGYHSNKFAVSLDHSESFLPFNGGWGQVTAVTVSLRIPHTGASLSGGVTMLPDHAIRFTADGMTWARGPWDIQSGSAAPKRAHSGKAGHFVVRGLVTDAAGEPVGGAAVVIGGVEAFTDGSGRFFVRLKTAGKCAVTVAVADFTAPGGWSVVIAPDSATPESELKIVVTR